MAVVNRADLLALMAEREELEWERQCLLDSIRNPDAFNDLAGRVTDFSTRLRRFVERLRTTLTIDQP